MTRSNHPCLWLITWDPSQSIVTRPLAIQKDGTWYTYGWDLSKNIVELYGPSGYIRNTYSYTPFGEVTAIGDVVQPIQWSSEFNDNDLGLVYYNYRYYNQFCSKWITRDPYKNKFIKNLYTYGNNPFKTDFLGLKNPFNVFYMRVSGLSGHAWIELGDGPTRTIKREDFDIKPEDKKLFEKTDLENRSWSITIPEAYGFYPIPETHERDFSSDLSLAFRDFDGHWKKNDNPDPLDTEMLSYITAILEFKNENPKYLRRYNTAIFPQALKWPKEKGYNINWTLQYGTYKGTPCGCKDNPSISYLRKHQVYDCIRNYNTMNRGTSVTSEIYRLNTNNCRDVAKKVLASCCLAVYDDEDEWFSETNVQHNNLGKLE